MPDPTGEAQLMRAFAGRDPRAARALYDRYAGRILGLGLVMLGDRAAAEDLVQDTFVKLWRSADRFDPSRGRLDTFVLMLARSLAVDALRRGDIGRLGRLLDASHRSLRDLFNVSTPAVEHTRALAKAHGALGARLVGGGFGGMVLALFPADAALPTGALPVRPDFGLTIDGTAPWPRFC